MQSIMTCSENDSVFKKNNCVQQLIVTGPRLQPEMKFAGLNAEASHLFRFRFSKPMHILQCFCYCINVDIYQPRPLKATLGGSIGQVSNRTGSAPLQTGECHLKPQQTLYSTCFPFNSSFYRPTATVCFIAEDLDKNTESRKPESIWKQHLFQGSCASQLLSCCYSINFSLLLVPGLVS